MKIAIKKIFEKNEYYDDIPGMVVTENKFKAWAIRIGLLLISLLLVVFIFGNLF